jgi:hypothetical protein
MSSRIDHASGVVTITGAGYTWASPGHRLYVGAYAAQNAAARAFDDFLARLMRSRQNGRAWGCRRQRRAARGGAARRDRERNRSSLARRRAPRCLRA